MERPLVDSRSLLLDPLRSSLRTGAIPRERTSLANSPGPPQSADLRLRRALRDAADAGRGAHCRILNVGLFESEIPSRPTNRKCELSRLGNGTRARPRAANVAVRCR